jgi:hypothetical protein
MILTKGAPISTQLSELLMKMLKPTDIEEVAKKHSFTKNYIRKVIRQERNVTDNNQEAIQDLTRLAVSTIKRVELLKRKI